MARTIIRIRIRGRLAPEWSDWFDDMVIHYEGPDTVLTGPVIDQPALYGVSQAA